MSNTSPTANQNCDPVSAGWKTFGLNLPKTWRGINAPWRQAVQRRRTMLHDELARLELTGTKCEERTLLIDQLLADANTASQTKVRVVKWWWGTEVERAWARLREVEERVVDLLPETDLLAQAAASSEGARWYLRGDDRRVLHLEALRLDAASKTSSAVPSGLRSSIVEVLRASHAQADRVNQEARSLRNRLLLASCLSIVFAALLVGAQWWFDEVRFLDPPEDWPGPGWALLSIVLLFGVIGALFTAIPAMSSIPSDLGPFNLPLQQALLKVAFGGLAAVAGLAIVSTDALQAGPPESWPGLLLLAIVFGAGQQAITRFVDKRAGEILTAATPASAIR